jgi:hypothetical protein
LTSLDVKLMTKDQYLGFQRGPRPEQSDQRQPDQAASFSHKAEALRDSASVASRIRFPTGTGSYIGLNAEIARHTKKRIERRLGQDDVWILNPGAKEYTLPDGARGGDYMLMWTQILEGDDGFGKGFDFVYFAGPSDFARFLSLRGQADMRKLGEFYDKRTRIDPELAKIDKALFRNYYGLKASVSFSYGSHDEWNIIRAINSANTI